MIYKNNNKDNMYTMYTHHVYIESLPYLTPVYIMYKKIDYTYLHNYKKIHNTQKIYIDTRNTKRYKRTQYTHIVCILNHRHILHLFT
jgi:hypothetical protein